MNATYFIDMIYLADDRRIYIIIILFHIILYEKNLQSIDLGAIVFLMCNGAVPV